MYAKYLKKWLKCETVSNNSYVVDLLLIKVTFLLSYFCDNLPTVINKTVTN